MVKKQEKMKLISVIVLFLYCSYGFSQSPNTMTVNIRVDSLLNNVGNVYLFDQTTSKGKVLYCDSNLQKSKSTLVYVVVFDEGQAGVSFTLKCLFDNYEPVTIDLHSDSVPRKIQINLVPHSSCELKEIIGRTKNKRFRR